VSSLKYSLKAEPSQNSVLTVLTAILLFFCNCLALKFFLHNYRYSFYMQWKSSDNAVVKYFSSIGL